MSMTQQIVAWAIPIVVITFSVGVIIGEAAGRRNERELRRWRQKRRA